MAVRAFLFSALCLFIAGCQTGADTDGALKSAEISQTDADTNPVSPDGAAGDDAATEDQNGAEPIPTAVEDKADPSPPAVTTPAPAATNAAGNTDPIAKAAADIAKLRKRRGERVAVEAVFACYKKAQDRVASLQQAQICAAQDFALSRDVISRRKPNASGTGDRALLISKRHPSRIGALMQLKGMGQAQFNTFGKYLHSVAEPAYKKALAS